MGDKLIDSFRKFSAELHISSPIPLDIIPLLTRDSQKQQEMAARSTAMSAAKPLPGLVYLHDDPKFRKPAQYTYPASPGAADSSTQTSTPEPEPMSAQLPSEPSQYQEAITSFQAPYYNIPPNAGIPGRSRHLMLSQGKYVEFMTGPEHINPPPPAPRKHEILSIPTNEFDAAEADDPHPDFPDLKKGSPAIQHLLKKDPYPRFDDVPGFTEALKSATRPLVKCVPEPGVKVYQNLEAILWEAESALRRSFHHTRNVTVADAIMRLECCRELAARVSAGEWDEKC